MEEELKRKGAETDMFESKIGRPRPRSHYITPKENNAPDEDEYATLNLKQRRPELFLIIIYDLFHHRIGASLPFSSTCLPFVYWYCCLWILFRFFAPTALVG